MFPILFGLMSVSSDLVIIIAGNSYSDAALPFVIFVAFALLRPLWISVSGVPVILGLAKKQAAIGVGAVLAEVLLAVTLIPVMSNALLATVSSVSSSIVIVGTWILVNDRFRLPFDWRLSVRLALLGGIQVFVSLVVAAVTRGIVMEIIVKVFAGLSVYLIGFRVMSIVRPSDLEDVNQLTGGRVVRLLGLAARILAVEWERPLSADSSPKGGKASS